jgi:hypothetical protein
MGQDLRVRGALLMAAATLSLTASGCGGGSSHVQPSEPPGTSSHLDSSGAASSDSRSTAEFIARSDAICRRLNTRLAIGVSGNLTVREMARLMPPRAGLEGETASELSRLKPPTELARYWRQILTYRRMLADELGQLGRDAKAKDLKAVKALFPSKRRAHSKLSALATRAGFKDCSRVG